VANYVVRYGAMRLLGIFDPPGDRKYDRGTAVILRTDRGLESGEVLTEATEKVQALMPEAGRGQILRAMTTDDQNELARLRQHALEELQTCQRHLERLGLEMQLIDVEHIFGGERIVVYYLAEGRVDFRQLVRILAGEFQTRIEMRQVGVRDEAKLLADYGDCGNPVCCNSHLTEMPPVSMKMAKLQKATLDPTKISGRCGRLKCCLRYEFDTYEEMQRELPAVGSRILTDEGQAKVIGQEILTQQVLVETEDRRRIFVHASDVTPAQDNSPTPQGRRKPPGA
jgi:cell fate regulator YaaT (PSP1 superfamily)